MRCSTFVAAIASISAVAAQQTHTVTVGANNGLVFEPNTLTVNDGDSIAFQFVSKNHTVTQSTFDQPCAPKPDGIDSGFVPVAAGSSTFPEWSITINNASAPMWFYCAQGTHCQSGMVLAVNPTAEKSFDGFLANAQGGGSGAPPSGPTGGSGAPPSGTTGGTGSTGAGAGSGPNNGAPAGGSPSDTATGPQGSNPADNSGAVGVSASKAIVLALLGVVGGLLL